MTEWSVTQIIMDLVMFGVPIGGMVWYLATKIMALEKSIDSNTSALTRNEECITKLTDLIYHDREEIVALKSRVGDMERRITRLEDKDGEH